MSYEKLGLADGNVLKAEHIEHIENGIANLEESINKPSLVTTTETGYLFSVIDAESDIVAKSNTATKIYSAQKNMFPHLERVHCGGSFATADYTFNKNEFTAKVTAGQTFKNLNFGPIYFPPGTYILHREWELLSGAGTGNIGWVYIHKVDKDGTTLTGNWNAIYSTATDVKCTFTEDTWLRFD